MSSIDPEPRRPEDALPEGSLSRASGRSVEPSESKPRAASGRSWPLNTIRYVLPAAVVIGGLVVMALGSENDLEGGAGIVSAGLAIYFLNWLFRLGTAGERERDAEEAARDYFDRHGRWPS
ncbi:MAG TPA: hypothetical protein VGL78_13190 [Solirubrobacteraceae bacterium]